MPESFLHLGAIYGALPGARIIHVVCDPLDTCLSIYFQDFTIVTELTRLGAKVAHLILKG